MLKKIYCNLLILISIFPTQPVLASFGGGSGGSGGGGGGSYTDTSSSSSSVVGKPEIFHPSTSDWKAYGIFVSIFFLFITVGLFLRYREVHNSSWKNISNTTEEKNIKQLFIKFQEAWTNGDLTPIEKLMTSKAYSRYTSILANNIKNGKKEIIEDINIKSISVKKDLPIDHQIYQIIGKMVDRREISLFNNKSRKFIDIWEIDMTNSNHPVVIKVTNSLEI